MLLKNQHKSPEDFSDRQERIYNFLRSCPIGVLSTVTPDGKPNGAVIYFTVDKEFNVSFVTKNETRKYENIKNNNQVTLTVYEPATQTSAQITGKAIEIKDGFEVNEVAGAIMAASMKTSEGGLPPISKLSAGEFVGFRIELDQIRMAVYGNPDPGDYSELFETIESFELKDD
jgi:uncharacterized pyridoxamine 5'-phosphate oxidase family protein